MNTLSIFLVSVASVKCANTRWFSGLGFRLLNMSLMKSLAGPPLALGPVCVGCVVCVCVCMHVCVCVCGLINV